MAEKTKRKAGRPPKPEALRRQRKQLSVYADEWAKWHRAAAAEGVSLSEWIRSLANPRADEIL